MVLLHKPIGKTSFGALWQIKHALREKRIGHTGTLDRFASGLLPVLVGPMTKMTPLLSDMDKTYAASFFFGAETDTLDPEGTVLGSGPIPAIGEIESVLPRFIGSVSQIPPQYSAVHVAGKRAYERARAGENPELKPRKITIHSIDITDYNPPVLSLTVRCSKGTYIRSLARDMGKACGSCAYVSALQRTEVGPFSLSAAVLPEDFNPERDLIPVQSCLSLLPQVEVAVIKDEWVRKILSGVRPEADSFESPVGDKPYCGLVSAEGRFLGLIAKEETGFAFCFVAGREA